MNFIGPAPSGSKWSHGMVLFGGVKFFFGFGKARVFEWFLLLSFFRCGCLDVFWGFCFFIFHTSQRSKINEQLIRSVHLFSVPSSFFFSFRVWAADVGGKANAWGPGFQRDKLLGGDKGISY